MPNWCLNDITFFTDSENFEELKRLHANMIFATTKFFKSENSFGKCWLGNIAEFHDGSHEEIPCRGIVNEISDIDFDSSIYYFNIQADSAWIPVVELWVFILKQYKNIEYVYVAEECGNDLFVNTDEERLFYRESYTAWNFDDDAEDRMNESNLFNNDIDFKDYLHTTMRFETEDELLNTFNRILVKKVNSYAELVNLEDSKEFNFTLNKFENDFL